MLLDGLCRGNTHMEPVECNSIVATFSLEGHVNAVAVVNAVETKRGMLERY